MSSVRYVCIAVLLRFLSADAAVTKGHHRMLRRHEGASSGSQPMSSSYKDSQLFKYRLRVCNAYPYAAPMDVYKGASEKLTVAPMPYKACSDFDTPLQSGDKLRFKVGDANAGTFSISDLPNNDALLLLVIHRHDTLTNAVSFESHVFASLVNAQVVIIDTYKGNARATPRIQDEAGGDQARSEPLRYNSVVAVNPGKYEVVLDLPDNSSVQTAKSELVAVNRESYVVLRTGVEAQEGESFPEELVIFPKTDEALLRGAAASLQALRLTTALPLLFAMAITLAGTPW